MDGAGGGAGGTEGGHDGAVYGGGFEHDRDCNVYGEEDSGGGCGGFLGCFEAFGHCLDASGGEGVHDGGFAAEVVEGGGEADASLGGEFSHGEFGFAFSEELLGGVEDVVFGDHGVVVFGNGFAFRSFPFYIMI